MDEKGNPIENGEYWESGEASVYDRNGNLLYSVDEEMDRQIEVRVNKNTRLQIEEIFGKFLKNRKNYFCVLYCKG